MQFQPIAESKISAIHQKALLRLWLSAAESTGGLPSTATFKPDPRALDMSDVMIVRTDKTAAGHDFVVQFSGDRVKQAYRNDCIGQSLRNLVPAHLAAATLTVYDTCATKLRPVYTAIEMHRDDATILHERLLLPLGTGSQIEAILASLHMISIDGAFNRSQVVATASRHRVLQSGVL